MGVVCTRKRLWRDADGNIVTKKPKPVHNSDASTSSLEGSILDEARDEPRNQPQMPESPLSPPTSLSGAEARVQDDFFAAPDDLQESFDIPPLMDTGAEAIDFFIDSQWPSQFTEPTAPSSNDAAFNDVFNPDTGTQVPFLFCAAFVLTRAQRVRSICLSQQ